MKYVIYGLLYVYLTTYQTDLLKTMDMGNIRVLYDNAWSLLCVLPKDIEIEAKTMWDWMSSNCCGSTKIHIGSKNCC